MEPCSWSRTVLSVGQMQHAEAFGQTNFSLMNSLSAGEYLVVRREVNDEVPGCTEEHGAVLHAWKQQRGSKILAGHRCLLLIGND